MTNFDLCYTKSSDRGKSWQSWDGKDLELQMIPENAYVVESIPQKSGLMNAGTLVVDEQEYSYIGSHVLTQTAITKSLLLHR